MIQHDVDAWILRIEPSQHQRLHVKSPGPEHVSREDPAISGGTGGPADSTLFYTLYLYQETFANFRMGYAAVLAWVLLVIIGAFTALSFATSKYWVHYEDDPR